MIAYVLVLIVSLSSGQTTQAVLEGPMSRSWCEQLIRQDRYGGEEQGMRKTPMCLSGQEAQRLLTASACARTPGPSRHWPSVQFDCAPVPTPVAQVTEAGEEAPVPAPVAMPPALPPERPAAGSGWPSREEPPPRVSVPARPMAVLPVRPLPPARSVPPISVVEEPPPPVQRQFRLGNAAQALVTQAHRQAGTGDYTSAAATIERALRIEGGNPLLWIELGRIRMAEGHAEQADGLYRKALAQASGDSEIEARAWGLIAESLRARGRNAEAVQAESHSQPATPN